ncbi:acylphosphatase 2 isoform X2 [Rhynchophorus ferrugineus]|uniref:acylphosphatase 2 isoform X2 n=1 Tax=Rhynchophorus ferrugineus TaxID=354439 RepID=UPI003FCE9409
MYLRFLYIKAMGDRLVSVDFEVFGRVQGVFFRKYTQQEATKLGLRGWCMNTEKDTVKGVMEGPTGQVSQMKNWLKKVGSPSSRIENAVFGNEHDISSYTFDKFSIKR